MALADSGDGRSGRLKSWKQIAAFFGTDERTVKRWESRRGLPVRRIPGGAKATVYADIGELERWLRSAKPAPLRAFPSRARIAAALAALLLLLAAGLALGLRRPAAIAHHQPTQEVADLYFAGQYNFERRTPESLRRAVQLFGRAIARDPAYAEAYAGLANCHLLLREYAGVSDADAYPRARAAAERALALDDRLADAHAAMAFITFFWERDFAAGLDGFRRAIALDPASGSAHHWHASALFHAGRVTDAVAEINRAQRLEPHSHAILADKGLILFHAGQAGEATALLRQIEAADPDYLSPHAYLAMIHLAQRDYPAFLAEERVAARLIGDRNRASVGEAARRGFEAGGAPAMFQAMIERQRQLHADGQARAYELAASYALAGNRSAAMRYLESSLRNRESEIVSVRMDPRFRGLHAAPDFRRFALSVGGPAASYRS